MAKGITCFSLKIVPRRQQGVPTRPRSRLLPLFIIILSPASCGRNTSAFRKRLGCEYVPGHYCYCIIAWSPLFVNTCCESGFAGGLLAKRRRIPECFFARFSVLGDPHLKIIDLCPLDGWTPTVFSQWEVPEGSEGRRRERSCLPSQLIAALAPFLTSVLPWPWLLQGGPSSWAPVTPSGLGRAADKTQDTQLSLNFR